MTQLLVYVTAKRGESMEHAAQDYAVIVGIHPDRMECHKARLYSWGRDRNIWEIPVAATDDVAKELR